MNIPDFPSDETINLCFSLSGFAVLPGESGHEVVVLIDPDKEGFEDIICGIASYLDMGEEDDIELVMLDNGKYAVTIEFSEVSDEDAAGADVITEYDDEVPFWHMCYTDLQIHTNAFRLDMDVEEYIIELEKQNNMSDAEKEAYKGTQGETPDSMPKNWMGEARQYLNSESRDRFSAN